MSKLSPIIIKFQSYFAFLILAGLFTTCRPEPNFPSTPKIEFVSIQYKRGTADTVITKIKFQDGEGDLGLGADERTGIFADTHPDGSVNLNSFNYLVDVFRDRATGTALDSISPTGDPNGGEFISYYGRYPLLMQDGKEAPLEGFITHKIVTSRFPIPSNRSEANFIFKIRIRDRKLNTSNRVTSPSVNIKR